MRFAFIRSVDPKSCSSKVSTSAIPAPGEARVRHTAVGLNYIDTYHRSGLYKIPLPSGLGSEAAGVDRGSRPRRHGPEGRTIASRIRAGRSGAYAEVRVMPIDRLVKLPEGVSDRVGGDADAQGADGAVPAAPDLPGQGRRDDPAARRRRRDRADRLPVGARARRHGDRYRRFRREGRTRQGQRLHAHHRLHARELRRKGQGAYWRQGRARGLRRGRQGYLSGLTRLPVSRADCS